MGLLYDMAKDCHGSDVSMADTMVWGKVDHGIVIKNRAYNSEHNKGGSWRREKYLTAMYVDSMMFDDEWQRTLAERSKYSKLPPREWTEKKKKCVENRTCDLWKLVGT